MSAVLKAPFPYFGGKSRVASLVWERFGNPGNYIEPFFGSGAVLFARPHAPKTETVNDADCYLANFWRALRDDPDAVAYYADWPVNEADLHARHLWLVNCTAEFREHMRTDPDYYDAKIAGWWAWGICQWIGCGWCEKAEWKQLPHLGNTGMGMHRPSQQRPHLGDPGMGVHRPSQKLPHLGGHGNAGGQGIQRENDLLSYFYALTERLRRVRVCCGDWSRIMGPSPTFKHGTTGVFLDPPYSAEAGRDEKLYAVESLTVAHEVREWAIANGDNPLLRIALCGYSGEHTMPDSWEAVAWKAAGGYGGQREGRGRANKHREMIWFSPACIKPNLWDIKVAG